MQLSKKVDGLFSFVRGRCLADGPLSNEEIERIRGEAASLVSRAEKSMLWFSVSLVVLLALLLFAALVPWVFSDYKHFDGIVSAAFIPAILLVGLGFVLVSHVYKEPVETIRVLTGYWLQEPASYDMGSEEYVSRILESCRRMPEVEEFRQKGLSMRKLLRADVAVIQEYIKSTESDPRGGTPRGRLNNPEMLVITH